MADTLSNITKRTLIRCISQLHDIGDVPWEVIAPVLAYIESAKQLEILEQNTPSLKTYDAHLWKKFIKRDIPRVNLETLEPAVPDDWAGVYRKLKKQHDKVLMDSTKILTAKIQKDKDEKKAREMSLTTRSIQSGSKTWGVGPARPSSQKTPGQKMLAKARTEAKQARSMQKALPRNGLPSRMQDAGSSRNSTPASNRTNSTLSQSGSSRVTQSEPKTPQGPFKGTLSSASAAALQRKVGIMNGKTPDTPPPKLFPNQTGMKRSNPSQQYTGTAKRIRMK